MKTVIDTLPEGEKIKESVLVLSECMDLQLRKGRDYQNPDSNVRQAMHYRRGIDSIHDILQGKMYRAQSLIESGAAVNFESLEDTYKDLINYASFAVEYLRGKMDGQDPGRDMFNRRTASAKEMLPIVNDTANLDGPIFMKKAETPNSDTFSRFG